MLKIFDRSNVIPDVRFARDRKLSGCIARGKTVAEVEQERREAIRFHIEADGLPVPHPSAVAEYMEV